MRRKLLIFTVLLVTLLCFSSCSKKSFSIRFIDVGQGDAALVECNGHYMLIDGGDKKSGEQVGKILKEQNIQKLDRLVISHFHDDHTGGLVEALKDIKIGLTISNSKEDITGELQHRIQKADSEIIVPENGEIYYLEDAKIEVIDVGTGRENDSLILLVTYGKTTFLFTGDMGSQQVRQICNRYEDEIWNVSLLKVGHHGAENSTSENFLKILKPQYALISVGENNKYGHPSSQTLERLEQANVKHIYRTDINGDIIVKSNGKKIEVKCSKK